MKISTSFLLILLIWNPYYAQNSLIHNKRTIDIISSSKFGLSVLISETEPNDTAHLANTVAIGDTIDGTIATENDIEYFKFEAVTGDTVEIFAGERGGSELWGLIMLFDESGLLLQNNSGNNEFTQQKIQLAIKNDGTYYIRYSNRNNWGGFPNDPDINKLDERRKKLEKGIDKIPDEIDIQALTGTYRIFTNRFTPSAPIVNLASAYGGEFNSIIFDGSLYPNGIETTVTFEYGTTTSYGNSIQPNPAVYNGLNRQYIK